MLHKVSTAYVQTTVHGQVDWDLPCWHITKFLDHSSCLISGQLSLFVIEVLGVKRRLENRARACNLSWCAHPLVRLGTHHIVLIDVAINPFLLHVPCGEDQTVVLQVLHCEVI